MQSGADDPMHIIPHIGRAYAKMGKYGQAKKILENTIEKATDYHNYLYLIASLCFTIGEMDCGFKWLERSVEDKESWLPVLRFSPLFASVQNDPRFQSLMSRIGIDRDIQEIRDT